MHIPVLVCCICCPYFAPVAAIVKNKLHRQAATLTEYKQKVVELQKRLIEVDYVAVVGGRDAVHLVKV